jgi:hypothetical protein
VKGSSHGLGFKLVSHYLSGAEDIPRSQLKFRKAAAPTIGRSDYLTDWQL